jgi:serine protease AprX
LVAPGTNIRAAKANSTNQYDIGDGTSFAAPAVAGTYALMLDAARTSGQTTIPLAVEDFGPSGYDKLYGSGNLIAYDSIKFAANQRNFNFDDNRDYYRIDSTGIAGSLYLYSINVYDASVPFNTTLLITNENKEDIDLYMWEPGKSYDTDDPTFVSNENTEMPQEYIGIGSPKVGTYTIGVHVLNNSGFSVDLSGKISP